ncbi:hypothetical protein GPECTOR_58g601 [Gonium pectorale]|uniref:Uncharacterized protein n=1 Tax=Gonium pectorale TaxID=33097 RepID=A0A150G5M2_GONPE|nr:hypothetical protein GPECTOR_58g601 [Gonium pectorale]|eukprot:KXZ45152.1 hypothetical protein GPECTOR_58g601 [Gonium pectorale]
MAPAPRPAVQLRSLVTVEGCMQLLMVVRVGEDEEEDWDTEEEQPEEAEAGRTLLHGRLTEEAAAVGGGSGGGGGGGGARELLPAVARLLSCPTAAAASSGSGSGGFGEVFATAAGLGGAFIWPSALPLSDLNSTESRATFADTVQGGAGWAAQPPPETQAAAAGEEEQSVVAAAARRSVAVAAEEGAGAGVEVLALLPAGRLCGQGAVRCVVAGPIGRSGRQTAHLDAIVELETIGGVASVSEAEETEGDGGEDAEYRYAR